MTNVTLFHIRHVLVARYTNERHQNVYGSDFKVYKSQNITLFGEGTSTKCTMSPIVKHNCITLETWSTVSLASK